MNHIRRTCQSLPGLPGPTGLLIASAAPAVLWPDPPLPPAWTKYLRLPVGPQPAVKFPPGWNKHPPLPAHPHGAAIPGMPGWHTTLIVVMAAVFAAAVIVVLTRPRQPHAATQPFPPESPPTDTTRDATRAAARPRPYRPATRATPAHDCHQQQPERTPPR
jgi:hypothetical protein